MEVKDAVDDDGGEGGEEDAALEKTSPSSITHIMHACPATFRVLVRIGRYLLLYLFFSCVTGLSDIAATGPERAGKYEWTVFSPFLLHIKGGPLLFLLPHFPISDLPPHLVS